jgi:23S rRNA pseudouridine1911/1915/1917 synthase
MKHYRQYTVHTDHQGMVLEHYLRQVLSVSGRSLQRLTRKKAIRLNGKPAYLQSKLKAGDRIRIYELVDRGFGVVPEPGPLSILYEDEAIVILNKPPFQLVHPTGHTTTGTLANYLAYYFQESGTVHTIRPLHRLDRDTSGCVVFAKQADIQHHLEQQLQTGEFKREYLAMVEGTILTTTGMIQAAIGNHPTLPNRRAIVADELGEQAITHYEVLDACSQATLLKLSLETGRTHQIRLHTAHIGHPIIGDRMYGMRSAWIDRQALHAYAVQLMHPHTRRPIRVLAPLPEDMQALWKRLSGHGVEPPQ